MNAATINEMIELAATGVVGADPDMRLEALKVAREVYRITSLLAEIGKPEPVSLDVLEARADAFVAAIEARVAQVEARGGATAGRA